jgi:hypothetical protein
VHDGRQGSADDWNAQEAHACIQRSSVQPLHSHRPIAARRYLRLRRLCQRPVHKYSPDGKLLFSWGEPGTDPGQFNLVHNIACDDEGWVYVADRENHRVQVFDSNGKYETQWHNLMRPCGLFVTRGREPIAVIGELGPETVASLTKGVPNLGPRLSVVSAKGEMLAHLGTEPIGEGLGQFIAPHGIALDSRGDIYVAEVANTYWPILFGTKPDHELRSLQKLVRVS